MLGRLHIHNVQRTQPTSGHLARPRSDYLSTIEVSPPRSPGLYTCGDARVDVAKVTAKVAKAAAKVAKVARPPTGASHPMVGVAPTQTILPGSRPHESAAVGGLTHCAPDRLEEGSTKERRLRSVQALKRTGTRLTDHESASTKDVTSTAPGAPRTSIEARLLFEGRREGGACRRFVGG